MLLSFEAVIIVLPAREFEGLCGARVEYMGFVWYVAGDTTAISLCACVRVCGRAQVGLAVYIIRIFPCLFSYIFVLHYHNIL